METGMANYYTASVHPGLGKERDTVTPSQWDCDCRGVPRLDASGYRSGSRTWEEAKQGGRATVSRCPWLPTTDHLLRSGISPVD